MGFEEMRDVMVLVAIGREYGRLQTLKILVMREESGDATAVWLW
jgi:hypothetical protein